MSGRIRIILLAAGRSARMGRRDKLRAPIEGSSILERSVRAAVESGAGEVVVVVGVDDYGSLLAPFDVRVVRNTDHAEGMAASIRAGVRFGKGPTEAYGILPADMPFLRPDTIFNLAARAESARIVVPQFGGRSGHPVFFGAAFRAALLGISGDVGARSVVESSPDSVDRVTVSDPGVLLDIDVPSDLPNE